MMTARDLHLIAGTLAIRLRAELDAGNTDRASAVVDVCYALADSIATRVPRFDRARFLTQCGAAGNSGPKSR